MRYEVALAGRALRIDLSADGRFAVGGRIVAADPRELVRGRQWSVLLDGRSHEVTLVTADPLRLDVDGIDVAAVVVDERLRSARGDGARATSGRVELRAPMPGLLKRVYVAEGDLVEREAPVVTLEAMKMENELRSPVRGRVTKVGYPAGTKVDAGAILAVLVEDA